MAERPVQNGMLAAAEVFLPPNAFSDSSGWSVEVGIGLLTPGNKFKIKTPSVLGGGKKTTSDHEPFNKNILFGELTLSTRDDPQHDRLLSCSLSKFEVQDENTIT